MPNQSLLQQDDDWKLFHLPTHAEHFYDVHRLEFDSRITVNTDDSCHVLMLVEGSSVTVEVDGEKHTLFIMPKPLLFLQLQEYTIDQ